MYEGQYTGILQQDNVVVQTKNQLCVLAIVL